MCVCVHACVCVYVCVCVCVCTYMHACVYVHASVCSCTCVCACICVFINLCVSVYQFFLSNRAVYLLLWNIRMGYEHAGLDFWLSSIACHAPKAPVLVIGTHYDKVLTLLT